MSEIFTQQSLVRAGVWVGSTLALLLFLFLFIAQVYLIPSPSMVPTLEVGDRVFVTKYSYGLRPYSLSNARGLGDGWSLLARAPERGDVVVVRNPTADSAGDVPVLAIKRVIGLPGDDIRLRDGVLEVRTQAVRLTTLAPATSISEPQIARGGTGFYLLEQFPDGLNGSNRQGHSHVITDLGPRRDDNFGPYTVPQGQLFLMGDNRDNSNDSRTRQLGPVPFDNLVGQAQFVVFSWKSGEADDASGGLGLPVRLDRFFKPIR